MTWPLGIVKLGPDLYDGSDSYSGYDTDGNFTGFSMLHESGTGGAPKYGVVSQMPVLGDIVNPLADHNDTRAQADIAEVGYYQSFLGSGITVELAGAERAGFYEYTFPDTDKTKNVIVDVSHVLSSYRGLGLQQAYLGGNIEVINGYSEDGYYQGYGSYNNVSPSSRRPLHTGHNRMLTTCAPRAKGLEQSSRVDGILLRSLRPCPGDICNVSRRRQHERQTGLLSRGGQRDLDVATGSPLHLQHHDGDVEGRRLLHLRGPSVSERRLSDPGRDDSCGLDEPDQRCLE